LIQNNTWELCPLPKGRHAIDNKWVFKVKSRDDSIDKFKARLVVKGFSQRSGIDNDETFSPVAHLSSVRLIFALAASHTLKLRQLEVVVGAFLQADLHEEIYMKQPDGFSNRDVNIVCRLKKSLYGLKQAGLEWNNTVNDFICREL
jgi:reverse transcriptase-like protein